MSALGRACRDRKSLVMSAVFGFADPNLFTPFFRLTGGHLLNVYKLARGMKSDKTWMRFQVCLAQNQGTCPCPFSELPSGCYNVRVHDLTSIQCDKLSPTCLLEGTDNCSLVDKSEKGFEVSQELFLFSNGVFWMVQADIFV